MWWFLAIPVVILGGALIFEYRIRQPDQIVLRESREGILRRDSRLYPRHFSLSIPATVRSLALEVNTEAKGRVALVIRITVSVAADTSRLDQLIRIGGWDSRVVEVAADELRVTIEGLVREYTELHEVEEISSAALSHHLEENLRGHAEALGLEMISVITQSVDPSDPDIAETLRQREEARIRERTEKVNQEARVAATAARIEADAQVADAEHDLALKRLSLKQEQEDAYAQLERMRIREELERREMQLAMDRQEVELVTQNPELLILTPQVARLAEASQSLRNARTVVSLSGDDLPEGSTLLQTLVALLQGGARAGGAERREPADPADSAEA